MIWTTTSNGEMEYLMAGSFSRVIAVSPVDSHLAIALGKTVWVTDWTTDEDLPELHLKADVNALAFSADGRYLATASGKSVQVWQLNGKQIRRLAHLRPVTKIAFGLDGKALATASGRTARIWEVATGEVKLLVKHHNQITDVSLSPDGNYLATASMDRTARLWNVATGEESRSIAHDEKVEVEAVVFSRDGKILVTTGLNTAWVWDALTGHESRDWYMTDNCVALLLALIPATSLLPAVRIFSLEQPEATMPRTSGMCKAARKSAVFSIKRVFMRSHFPQTASI